MKCIAVANMKGGVGKTTTSLILSDVLSAILRKRVLLMDLDAQANLSWAILGPTMFSKKDEVATLTRWCRMLAQGKPSPLSASLHKSGLRVLGGVDDSQLSVSIANTDLRFQELLFEEGRFSELEMAFRSGLSELAPNFDYVIFDCSPALSALTRVGLGLADSVIVPTPPNALCYESLQTFVSKGMGELIKSKARIYVCLTRMGISLGATEANYLRKMIRQEYECLDPAFKEAADYMRALSPPQIGVRKTLQARYGSRVDDLRRFAKSLSERGVL